ncbi:hypothetical protein F4808DRAFT_433008 [Astrocystis sublimbata]|nr:hypothetical protein F4808DRAFT_433008 [Astrocystis sublimbata]
MASEVQTIPRHNPPLLFQFVLFCLLYFTCPSYCISILPHMANGTSLSLLWIVFAMRCINYVQSWLILRCITTRCDLGIHLRIA